MGHTYRQKNGKPPFLLTLLMSRQLYRPSHDVMNTETPIIASCPNTVLDVLLDGFLLPLKEPSQLLPRFQSIELCYASG